MGHVQKGNRIAKLDIPEYSRPKRLNDGRWKGIKVELGEADCNWLAVRLALKETGYRFGWTAAEVPIGARYRLAEIARRMNQVVPQRGEQIQPAVFLNLFFCTKNCEPSPRF